MSVPFIKNQLITDEINNAIVTDVIHMPRAAILAEWVLGDNYKIYQISAKINIVGLYREAMEKKEKYNYDLTIQHIVNVYKKGDDKSILEYEERIRESNKSHIAAGGSRLDAPVVENKI